MIKKWLFLAMIFCGYAVCAQVNSPNALGVRFGENDGFRMELTYQARVTDMNRIEANFGYRENPQYNVYKLTGLYQWVWFIDEGFNWYAGFGSSLGQYNLKQEREEYDDDEFFINADVNIGLEYIFDGPFMVSIDLRPEFNMVGSFGDSTDFDLGLSVRYLF